MTGPPSYDNDLLARLNALKRTNISLEPEKPSLGIVKDPVSHEDALSARLKSLRNGAAGTPSTTKSSAVYSAVTPTDQHSQSFSYTSPDVASDQEDGLPSFLKLSKPSSGWDASEAEAIGTQSFKARADAMMERMRLQGSTSRAARQDREAASHVPTSHDPGESEETANSEKVDPAEATDLQARADALLARMKQTSARAPSLTIDDDGNDSDGTDLEAEAREAEELLAQLMDEVQLEAADEESEEHTSTPPPARPVRAVADRSDKTNPSPNPTQPPPQASAPPDDDDDFESALAARMAALNSSSTSTLTLPSTPSALLDSLGLPSAPTAAPSKAASTSTAPPKPKEPDDWCCVCYADATIVCHGCGAGWYCARCWREGHTGPNADWEDRAHQWESYRRPR